MRSYYSEGEIAGNPCGKPRNVVDIGTEEGREISTMLVSYFGQQKSIQIMQFHLSKATRMTKGQKASAVRRKRAKAGNTGPKPKNVKTFA